MTTTDSVPFGYQRLGIYPLDEHNQKLLSNVHPENWQNPTPAASYNLVVIGGGSAGLIAAVAAAGLGARVALIERHLLGGDCLNVGCVPSKAIIRSSRVVAELNQAARFGVHLNGEASVDFGAVMERMRRVRASISPHDSAERFRDLGVDVFLGEGQFTSAETVEVAGKRLHFKKAVIATGSRPFVVPIAGIKEAGYLTNETIFNLTERPERLAVIGAGPIGSELAQAFNRLGSEVVLFDLLPQILGREDKEAAAIVESVLRDEGIRLELGVKVNQVSPSPEGKAKVIEFERNGQSFSLSVDDILLAVGRVPNVETLNLEAAGVEFHRKGIKVDDTLQTTNPNIYAAGDVALKYQFTHTADASARIILQNALFPGPKKKVSSLVIPWVTYTDPEVAHVGLYEHEAHEQGIKTDIYKVDLSSVDRAVTDGETAGFVKILTKKGSGKILGATIVAPHAGEMINELTLAMTQNIGLGALANVIHPYPTQSEAIRRAADVYNRTRLKPLYSKILSAWFNWRRK